MNIPESAAAVARPGDTLLITLRDRLSDDELDEMYASLQGFFAETGVHIALLEGVEMVTVVRPEPAERDL